MVVCLGECGYFVYTKTTQTSSPENIITQADVTPTVTIQYRSVLCWISTVFVLVLATEARYLKHMART